MTTRTWYVTLFRAWSNRRWVTRAGVGTDRPILGAGPLYLAPGDTRIAVYEVQCPTKGEAVPVVMEWLATGRPRAMTVTEMLTHA